MLAFIASRIHSPVVEAPDRDPGILTLAFTVARVVRRSAGSAFGRRPALGRAVCRSNPV